MRWLSLAATCVLVSGAMTAAFAAFAWAAGGDEPPGQEKAAAAKKGAADSPGPGKEAAAAPSPEEQLVRAETDIELLELDVEVMRQEFQNAFAALKKLEDVERGRNVDSFQQQLMAPELYRSITKGVLPRTKEELRQVAAEALVGAREQFENDRRRYLEQRQRLRRLRNGDPPAEDRRADSTSGEIGDRIEQAQVDEQLAALDVSELKLHILKYVKLIRSFQFQGEALRPGSSRNLMMTRQFRLQQTDQQKEQMKQNHRELAEEALTKLHELKTQAEAEYLKAKLQQQQLAKRLDDLQEQYQKARFRERLERVVRVGDYLYLHLRSTGQSSVGRVDADGVVTFRDPSGLILGDVFVKTKVAGLTTQQAKAAVVESLHQHGCYVNAMGEVWKGAPQHPVRDPHLLVPLTVETPLEHSEAQRQSAAPKRSTTGPAEIDVLIEALQKLKQSGGR